MIATDNSNLQCDEPLIATLHLNKASHFLLINLFSLQVNLKHKIKITG